MRLQSNPILVQERMIQTLSLECATSIVEVERLYRQEWARLAAQARLTEFLPVLAGRGVRDVLRRRKRLAEVHHVPIVPKPTVT